MASRALLYYALATTTTLQSTYLYTQCTPQLVTLRRQTKAQIFSSYQNPDKQLTGMTGGSKRSS